MITRRGFLGFLAAPAIVRASSLMPIVVVRDDLEVYYDYVRKMQKELEEAIYRELASIGPVYYNDGGIDQLTAAIERTKMKRLFS